ncbi:MAG: hypothetical protein ACYC0W_00655 [Candidatus Nanopelagicales bacterium]
MRARRRTLRPAPALLALLLAACGTGTVPVPSGSSATAGVGTAEFGMTQAQLGSAIDRVESAIASCMAAAGFEYVAADVATVRAAMAAVGAAPGLADADYVAQFGYGISTQFDNPAADIGLGARNRDIIAALPPSEQSAYRFTLLGEHPTATFAVALDAEDFSLVGGCTGTAVGQVFDTAQLEATYVNPKDLLVEQDPRVIAATQAWSDCMRGKGFTYPTQADGEDDISARLAALLGGDAPQALDPARQALLVELQGEELALARADFDCAADVLDPVVAQVETEIFGEPQG